MEASEILRLSIAALLTAYLVFRHWLRERQRPREPGWSGHGMDVSELSNRVQRVRGDFLSALKSRPHDAGHRGAWLASARRVVGRLSYFQRRAAPNAGHLEQGAETHAA